MPYHKSFINVNLSNSGHKEFMTLLGHVSLSQSMTRTWDSGAFGGHDVMV